MHVNNLERTPNVKEHNKKFDKRSRVLPTEQMYTEMERKWQDSTSTQNKGSGK